MSSATAYATSFCTPDPDMLWMFESECPHCGRRLKVPEQYLGVSGQCNHCRGAITPIAVTAASRPVAATSTPSGKNPAWYAARRRHFEYCTEHYAVACAQYGRPEMQGPWEKVLERAKATEDSQRQKELYLQAIVMGCPWPFPYERLALLYAKEKDFQNAFNLCVRYFDQEHWKTPQWAASSRELLALMERLERKQ